MLNILHAVTDSLGSPSPYLVPIVSILVTIIEFVVIAVNVKRISEHGFAGAIVSGTGFLGTLLVFGGAMGKIEIATYVGVAMWFAGLITVRISE